MTDIDSGAMKIIEIIGVSPHSFEDAVNQAVSKAGESIKGITGVEVISQSAEVKDATVSRYLVRVKLSFVVR
jgi:flavin-binding protein dodecin